MTVFGDVLGVLVAMPGQYRPAPCASRPDRARWGAASACSPGLWRLRLPLPWPGVPHCNAWAIAAGDGIVLVDTGTYEPGSMGHLDRALEQVGLKVENVKLVVITHAHADHCGQAHPIADRAGCEVWAHPNHAHFSAYADDPEAAHAPPGRDRPPERRAARAAALRPPARRRPAASPTATCCPASTSRPTSAPGRVHETPGHAPSHVVLFQRERRLLISGDHLLGRVSLYFDYGYTPDPVGEFLASLDATERARRAAGAVRPRAPVRRRRRARRGQPAAGAAAARRGAAPRSRTARRPPTTSRPSSTATRSTPRWRAGC